MRCMILIGSCALLCACTPHDDLSDPPTLVTGETPPAIVQEAEPEVPPPPTVAPPLPDLAPKRPLRNLAPLWTQERPATTIVAVGRAAVAIRPDAAAALGLDGPSSNLERLGDFREALEVAGPLMLGRKGEDFFALELGTDGLRWTTPAGRSYGQFVTPRVFVAEFHGDDVDHVVAWALADGREVWRRTGGGGEQFVRIRALLDDETRGYLLHGDGLEAFDPHTGANLWSYPLTELECGATAGEDKVVIERPHEYVVLDAETGKLLGQIPTPNKQECNWESYDHYIAPAVIANGRLHVFDGHQPDGSVGYLRAFELDGFTEVWHAKGFDADLLLVDHDAVYVARKGAILLGLDAETGKPQTELSIGVPFSARVEPVGGAAGPLVVVATEDGGTWLLGRAEAPPTLEDYEIRGQLTSDYLEPRRLAKVRVRVGDQEVETDKRGRFVVRGRGRGSMRAHTPERSYEDSTTEWTWIEFEPKQVMLDGSGKYDLGEVEVWEASMG